MIEALLNGVSYDILYSTAGQPNIYLGWNIEYDMRNISVIENNDYYVQYYYNASGIGIGKTIDNNNSIEYVDYVLEGSNIIKETHTGSNNYTLEYYYDAYSRIINTEDTSEINPYRYRGYYYDIETGLFYCNSRYYNPEWGRFISLDSIEYLDPESINGLNLYCYCMNNPVNYKQGPVLGGSSSGVHSSLAVGGSAGLGGSSSPISHTLKGSFRSGLFFGSGSITGFYNDWNVRSQISLRKGTIKLSLGGKFSLVNASGQIGFGTEDLNLVLKAVGDVGSVSGMAGIFIDPRKDTYFVGVEAKATALSGRVGGQLDIIWITS